MQIVKYARKPFIVEAVQATEENLEQLALWVGGDIVRDDETEFVKVDVKRPLNERQTRAHVGDWVLKSEQDSFKVYTNKAFHKTFHRVTENEPEEVLIVAGDDSVVPSEA